MAMQDIAQAVQRVQSVLRRRPEAGLHDDPPATAKWAGGTRIVAHHDSGLQMATDMPTELGGSGDQVSPGWLLRAGVASCAATSIALHAAAEGITIELLEVRAASRSDARGLLGVDEADGTPVYPGPLGLQMEVRIAAPGVAAERLRALVDRACSRAPMSAALRDITPIALSIAIEGDADA